MPGRDDTEMKRICYVHSTQRVFKRALRALPTDTSTARGNTVVSCNSRIISLLDPRCHRFLSGRTAASLHPFPTLKLFSDRLLLLHLRAWSVLRPCRSAYSCCAPRLNGGTLVRTGSMEGSFPSLAFTGWASAAGSMNCSRVSALFCLSAGKASGWMLASTE